MMKEEPMTLPVDVIREDQRLDGAAASAQEQLAELRWRWTLDESNPDRVSFRAYGDAVGRSHTTIRQMAHGYAEWSGRDIPSTRSLTDEIELAKLGADKRAATEAVAEATGLSVGNVASAHRDKVKDTLAAAQTAAERRGTSVEDELPRIAEAHEKTRRLERQRIADQRARKSTLLLRLELRLSAAERSLVEVLTEARAVELDDDLIAALADSLGRIKAVIGLLDLLVAGVADVDWDAEAQKLGPS
jgi:hypothetical protein